MPARAQDISHLLDICRQTIIFEDPSSLAKCMSIIDRDSEANVVRVKNRLDPTFNTARSAGYRDVALNLKLVTEETLKMGLEEHVCEVQLILLPMFQLKVRALCVMSLARGLHFGCDHAEHTASSGSAATPASLACAAVPSFL